MPVCAVFWFVPIAERPVPRKTQFTGPSSKPGLRSWFAGSLALWPSGLVTVTSTVPSACGGAVAVMEVLWTVTLVAGVPPNVTVAFGTKLAPVMVTMVPPALGPELGRMVVTIGGGAPPAAEAKLEYAELPVLLYARTR